MLHPSCAFLLDGEGEAVTDARSRGILDAVVDEIDRVIVEVNVEIARLVACLGPDAAQVEREWPRGRGPDGRLLLLPRIALLATLCEHPDAVTPSADRVDAWEQRTAETSIDDSDDDPRMHGTRARIRAITFEALRARLRETR